jgi:hypothetical protein
LLGARVFDIGLVHQVIVVDGVAQGRIKDLLFDLRVNGSFVADGLDQRCFLVVVFLRP